MKEQVAEMMRMMQQLVVGRNRESFGPTLKGSKHPCSKCVHATNKESSQQTSKGDNKVVKRACKKTLEKRAKQGQTNMLSTRRGSKHVIKQNGVS